MSTPAVFRSALLFPIVYFCAVSCLLAASPSLDLILPRGCQRGTEHILTFQGKRLKDAQEIFFYDSGFVVTKLEPENNSVKVHLKIAPDCRLGEHAAQVRTASGISELRTFYVGPLPSVAEKEPNNAFDAPQKIELNVTLEGIVTDEDVDYFMVEAKKGQRIVAEIEGMRLGSAMFDPYVAILDMKRFELSAADDSPLIKQDAVASIVAPKDGTYVVEVRESAFGGNDNCRYRLHVGNFPRPTAVFPAGGKLGQKIKVRYIGDPSGDFSRDIQLPTEQNSDFRIFAKDNGGIVPSGNPFRLFAHGNALEKEPNDSLKEATSADLPVALNGIIETKGDTDWFKFQAKKGQAFEVECYARRIRSPLDPVMSIHDAKGKSIESNDDSRGPDSYIRFTVPTDGEYSVRVRDHLRRGGRDFVYRIEFSEVQRSLTLGIPQVQQYSQYRQTIFVPRGNRFATLISANRANVGGDLILDGKNLPDGIKMICDPMPKNMNVMPVVFEAAADAPIAGRLVNFTGRLADAKENIQGGFRNTAELIRGEPGNAIYWTKRVDRLAMAVVDTLPFKLEIVEPKVPLVRDGSMRLKIVAHRNEGFKSAIKVRLPFRPPGLGAGSSVTIPESKNEVIYEISANSSAQINHWKIFVIGSADVSGTAWVSSQLAKLEIAEPHLKVAMERASCEQGEETQVYCKLEHAKEFEGKAIAKLLGLPNQVTAAELEFTKETKELVFQVKTDQKSPAGKHKSLFCQIQITQNGEPIVSRAGTTALQIDKPLPIKQDKPKPKPPPKTAAKKAEPKKPKAKPLTRLQKLRLQAKNPAGISATEKP